MRFHPRSGRKRSATLQEIGGVCKISKCYINMYFIHIFSLVKNFIIHFFGQIYWDFFGVLLHLNS